MRTDSKKDYIKQKNMKSIIDVKNLNWKIYDINK